MESKLDEILGGHQKDEQAIAEALALKKAERASQVGALIIDIKNGGEGTGDKLTDNVLLMYGVSVLDNPKILERYQKVNDQLKGKIGQPVVIMSRWPEAVLFRDPIGPNEYAITGAMRVGKLSAQEMIFKQEDKSIESYLPTSQFVDCGQTVGPSTEGLMPTTGLGPWHIANYLGNSLDEPIAANGFVVHGLHNLDYEFKQLEIIVGAKNIQQYMYDELTSDRLPPSGLSVLSINYACEQLRIPRITEEDDIHVVLLELRQKLGIE